MSYSIIVKQGLLILILLILTGCGSALRYPNGIEFTLPPEPEQPLLEEYIWSELKNWQGVPYKWGGVSKKGVDCSGLTLIVYRKLFGINLPRTTVYQVKTGSPVSKKGIIPGDLIFFISPEKINHVGIYLGNRKFIHASDKKGKVIVSNIDSPYWRKAYLTSRRVIPEDHEMLQNFSASL